MNPLHDPLPIPSPDNLQIWLTRETKNLPSDLPQTAKEIAALRSLAHHLRDLALRESHDWTPYYLALRHLIQILHEAKSAREHLLKVKIDLHDLWTE